MLLYLVNTKDKKHENFVNLFRKIMVYEFNDNNEDYIKY